LAVNLEAVEKYGARLTDAERRLAERLWPGALTLVLAAGAHTEGFRVPAHRLAQRLLESVGGVLRVTSANLSGEPPARTAGEALQCLGPHVEVVLDDGPVTGGVPSTVVRLEGREVRILRAGAISENEIKKAAS
jgi:tRNA threonylcarbamoyl adenosine modification protein (Sua5/YciO/YrdC/YwlC family)